MFMSMLSITSLNPAHFGATSGELVAKGETAGMQSCCVDRTLVVLSSMTGKGDDTPCGKSLSTATSVKDMGEKGGGSGDPDEEQTPTSLRLMLKVELCPRLSSGRRPVVTKHCNKME